MTELRFARVADAVVRTLTAIKEGESVLVVADTGTNLAIAHAYLAAAINVGAKAALVVERERRITEVAPVPSVNGALERADVVLGLGRSLFTRSEGCQAALARGARVLVTEPRGMEDYLIEGIVGVDYDGLVSNARLLGRALEAADRCTIRSELGTDISCKVGGRPVIIGDGMALDPGELDYYPGCQVTFAPVEETLEGVIVVDGSMSTLGLVTDPFRLVVEAGKVVAIEGGVDARRYKQHLEQQGDPKLFEICHYSFGMNPRASLSGNIFEDERYYGCLDIGFGSQDPSWGGTVGTSKHHVDIVLASPEVSFDSTVVIQNNQFATGLGFLKLS